jgi:hypothetical protein
LSSFQGYTGSSWYTQIANNSGTTSYDLSLNPYGGNVGIGTSSPDRALHVSSGIANEVARFESTDTACLVEFKDTTGTASIETRNDFRFSAGGSERMRIDASGNLLVGTTVTPNTLAGASATQGLAFNGATGYLVAAANNTATAYFNRQGSDGTITEFRKDGTAVGSISAGASSGGTNPIAIGFGTSGLWFIPAAQAIAPFNMTTNAGSDNSVDLGYSSLRFDDIYATNGTIQTSDRNEKQGIRELLDAEQRVATACKGLLRAFKWNSAVEEKGDEARIHFGIIAQDLQDAFTAEGLDAGDYAMFINSTWTDEETGEERSRMGVRYSELLAFIISAI